MAADFVIAVYAAVVSSVLAVMRLTEFRQGRERLHFSVYAGQLHSADPALLGLPKPEYVVIAIGNRAPFAVHITHIGFTLRGGTALLTNPIAGGITLPKKLEPTEGLIWLIEPDRLAENMPDCTDDLLDVYAFDGSGRRYERRITRKEREQLRRLVGPKLTTWGACVRAWWIRRRR